MHWPCATRSVAHRTPAPQEMEKLIWDSDSRQRSDYDAAKGKNDVGCLRRSQSQSGQEACARQLREKVELLESQLQDETAKKASRRDDISKSDRDAKLRKIENETSAITQQIKDQAKQLENTTAATKKLESVASTLTKELKKGQVGKEDLAQLAQDAAATALSKREKEVNTGGAITTQDFQELNKFHITTTRDTTRLQMMQSHKLQMHLVDAVKRKSDFPPSWEDPSPKRTKADYFVKCSMGDTPVHRFQLEELSILELNTHMRDLYGEGALEGFKATYKDVDGDVCALSRDQCLNLAFKALAPNNTTLRVELIKFG